MGCAGTRAAFEQSLALLQTDYLDLYLIHWPKQSPEDTFWEQRMLDTWKTMEELYEAGKIRAIGVSNFLPHHLEALLEKASVRPAVDQLEFHPGYLQGEALEFCKKEQTPVQAWSPIGRGRVLRDPLLQGMAAEYGVSVAQLCLRFDIQMGVMPLPKASSIERMRENLEVLHPLSSARRIWSRYGVCPLPDGLGSIRTGKGFPFPSGNIHLGGWTRDLSECFRGDRAYANDSPESNRRAGGG